MEGFFNRLFKKQGLDFKQARGVVRVLQKVNLAGGKRLRSVLIQVGYYLAGGKGRKSILEASLSIELIHNYFLIHDDIIDRDELRRGQLSLHEYYRRQTQDSHTGISLALAAGDINAALGYQALLESDFPAKRIVKALNILNWTVVRTCQGEMLEIFLKQEKHKKEKDILKVTENKTAFYTIIAPLQIGAALAGAGSKFLKQLEEIGLPLGVAFQLQDDILGIFASEKKLGKPVGSDISENQPNLLIFRSLIMASPQERQKIERCLGKEQLSRTELKVIKKVIQQSRALGYCQKKAEQYVFQAKKEIQKIKASQKQKDFLLGLADYIIKRNY